jgi:hypothetical protein
MTLAYSCSTYTNKKIYKILSVLEEILIIFWGVSMAFLCFYNIAIGIWNFLIWLLWCLFFLIYVFWLSLRYPQTLLIQFWIDFLLVYLHPHPLALCCFKHVQFVVHHFIKYLVSVLPVLQYIKLSSFGT